MEGFILSYSRLKWLWLKNRDLNIVLFCQLIVSEEKGEITSPP